ncbi:hypothetical protein [Lacihabitans soyangensis]|uniref:Uncharacterized protein n=1 Tax=Lacihabitans soyangensis TaxID=869394 RepID=A0AAE3H442_9BACT|nr:hypothetical protein [Lacihabitans soyangensis]MCP9763706.1 hypothetical protein [Lacihabitans soyangensis]
MQLKYLQKFYLTLIGLSLTVAIPPLLYAQGNVYVESGSELSNFGTIDLATPSSNNWVTYRGASPGYYSAVGTAGYTNPGDAANVNGYVKHYANATNQTFNFPVGTGSDYRALSISGTRTATSQIAVAWILGNPSSTNDPTAPNSGLHPTTSVGAGLQSVSSIGQWDWYDATSDATGLTVTVSIPNLTAFGTAADLRLVGWDGTNWVNLSSSGASGNTENSTLSGVVVSGITALAIGKISSSPVDYTPTIDIDALTFNAAGFGRDFVVNIYEALGGTNTSSLQFRMTKPSAFTLTYPTTNSLSQVFGGTNNNNSDWTFSETSLFITATLKAGVIIPANGQSVIGFRAQRKSSIAKGTSQNLAVTILDSTGGDSDTFNNTRRTSITAN